jgi:hypothetical protein
MAAKKLWTARKLWHNCIVAAQCKSSLSELTRRLKRDDPLWENGYISYTRQPRFKKKHFKRGLAVRVFT